MASPEWNRYARALPSIAAAVGRTPAVRLNRVTAGVTPAIYVKVEWYGTTGSFKDRIYLHMFERAEARRALKPGMTVLECSTGIACSWVAAVKGYPCTIVMPEGMSIVDDPGQRYLTTPLCGEENHVDIPEREHPLDPYTVEHLDRYQKAWEIIG